MSRAQRRSEERLRRSRNKKIASFEKKPKVKNNKDIKAEISEFFKDFIDFTLDGPGKIFLAIIALCLVVIAAMYLNKARAHLVIGMDSQLEALNNGLNEIAEQAEQTETTEVSETTKTDYEYESIIPEETREKAEKNGVTVEKQIESDFNNGLANYLTALLVATILIIVFKCIASAIHN